MSKTNHAFAQPLPTNPTRELVNASDLLLEARLIASFVHSIGLGPAGQGIELNEDQTSGFCYVMRDMMDRIQKADELMGSALDSLRNRREGE
jgi:hypothetical protein